MSRVPRGNRLHIALFGWCNAGKSSLLNALTRQNVSIVSEIAGTTTDPVEKPMELLPIGPVVFIDTAGIDDCGALGELRVRKTRQVFDRPIVMIVTEAVPGGISKTSLLEELRALHTARRRVQQVGSRPTCETGPASISRLTDSFVKRPPRKERGCWNCARHSSN